MRIFITTLALFAFSLHLLLGCCAHHAHGDEGLPGHHHAGHGFNHVHLPAWLCHNESASCEHGHVHHEHEQESAPAPHLPCMDPECVYVGIDHQDQPTAHDVAMLPVIADEPLFYSASITNIAHYADCEEISPHVRRHLALCHFLN